MKHILVILLAFLTSLSIFLCSYYTPHVHSEEKNTNTEGVYYVDTGDTLLPSKKFMRCIRSLAQFGYYPVDRKYFYYKEKIERPPTGRDNQG